MHFSKDMKYPISDKKNPDLDFSNYKAAVVKKIFFIYNGFLTVEQWKIPEFWWAFESVHRIKMLFLFLFFFSHSISLFALTQMWQFWCWAYAMLAKSLVY